MTDDISNLEGVKPGDKLVRAYGSQIAQIKTVSKVTKTMIWIEGDTHTRYRVKGGYVIGKTTRRWSRPHLRWPYDGELARLKLKEDILRATMFIERFMADCDDGQKVLKIAKFIQEELK